MVSMTDLRYLKTFRGRRAGLMAALVVLVSCLTGALILPVTDRDEAVRVQATTQMIEDHGRGALRFQSLPLFDTPPGLHWVQAALVGATADVGDRPILNFRLASILGGMLGAIGLVWGARARRRDSEALIPGVLMGLSLLAGLDSVMATPDSLFAGLIGLMMGALARVYQLFPEASAGLKPLRLERLIFWSALGGAIMVGGLAALGLGLIVIGGLWVWDRQTGRPALWVRQMGWGWGSLILLAMCGPWVIDITIRSDGAYWTSAFASIFKPHHVLAGIGTGHPVFGLAVWLILPVLIFPWSFLGPFGIGAIKQLRTDPLVRVALIWLGGGMVMSFAGLWRLDPLPGIGGLMWLIGAGLGRPETATSSGSGWVSLGLSLMAAVLVVGAAIWFYLSLDQRVAHLPLVVAVLVSVGLTVWGGIGCWRFNGHELGRRSLILIAIGAVLTQASLWCELASAEDLWVSQRMEQALIDNRLDPREGRVAGPVSVVDLAEPSFVFTMGTGTEIGASLEAAVIALSQRRPVFVTSGQRRAFESAARQAGLKPQPVETVDGFDYAAGRWVSLELYRLRN